MRVFVHRAVVAGCALVLAACASSDGRDDATEAVDDGDAALTTIGTDAHAVTLIVDAKGVARVTFLDKSNKKHIVLAWGAVDAIAPDPTKKQVTFSFNYAGGYGSKWGTGYANRMTNVCRPYTGPALPLLVKACDAPDGSHWAVQSWQRLLPDGGYTPSARQAAHELHVSHWKAPLPVLEAWANWTDDPQHLHRIFGRLTYQGQAVYGLASTSQGSPLDGFGRNVYLDVHDPAWTSGWSRFNSALTHDPAGNFCLGTFALFGRTVPAQGDAYRLTVLGPGVTPIVRVAVVSPGTYDDAAQTAAKTKERTFVPAGDSCY